MKTIKHKNRLINMGVLSIGILIGWLVFGNKASTIDHSTEHNEKQHPDTWICSMHPQIKQAESGDCPICGMDLIPMTTGTGNSNPAQIEMSDEAMKLANIQTSIVTLSKTEKELFVQGKVEIDERLIATQAVHFSGRIEKLFVAFEGQKVVKGQKLATIYSPQLVMAQQELFEALKSKNSYPQLYTAAVNKLKLWKLTDAQIKEIENNKTATEQFDVVADASGYVTKKHITVGDYVKTGDMIFEISNLNRLWIMFDVYEKDLPFISIGNTIDFTVNSLPSQTFSAKISYIDPVINQQKRTASIRTEVVNTGGHLKPEMFVNGKLTADLSHRENAIVIPKSAIMWTGKRSIVYVKVAHTQMPVFELKQIELGEPLGAFYIVNKGIKEGDEVVTNGTFTVDAAAQLNSKYSMMNPPIKEGETEMPNYKTAANKAFTNQLNEVLIQYFALKENLVAANSANAIVDAKLLLQQLKKTNKKLLKGDALNYWLKHNAIIDEKINKIIASKNIDTQRKEFKPLSKSIIATLQSFGVTTQTVYIQYCPMADNDNGAFWLSTKRQVINPYFGDMMLRCGEVTDSIDTSFN